MWVSQSRLPNGPSFPGVFPPRSELRTPAAPRMLVGLSGAARAPIPGPGPGPAGGVALLPQAPDIVKKTEAPFFPSRGRGPPAPARSDDASFPLSPLARPSLAGCCQCWHCRG